MEVKLEFQDLEKVSLSPFPFDFKNLQTRCKFAGERDFPIQNSYMDHVQCLSHSGDQKLETSLVQSAIEVTEIQRL